MKIINNFLLKVIYFVAICFFIVGAVMDSIFMCYAGRYEKGRINLE